MCETDTKTISVRAETEPICSCYNKILNLFKDIEIYFNK